jgi:RNA-directed DNA polymerase
MLRPASWTKPAGVSPVWAMEVLRKGFIAGSTFVVEFDIRDFLGSIDHDRLLGNIYLHALDVELTARDVGTLVRYADDGLHPGKTKVVDLREGREGFDFLGCHFCARMSRRLWEQKRVVRYYLPRWPSEKAMKRPGKDQTPDRPSPRWDRYSPRHRCAAGAPP